MADQPCTNKKFGLVPVVLKTGREKCKINQFKSFDYQQVFI